MALGGNILTSDTMMQAFAYPILTLSSESNSPTGTAGEHCMNACHHCDKIPMIGNLKWRRICSDSWLQKLLSTAAWCCCLRPVVAPYVKVASHLMTAWSTERGELGKFFKNIPPATYDHLSRLNFFQSRHLSVAPQAEALAFNAWDFGSTFKPQQGRTVIHIHWSFAFPRTQPFCPQICSSPILANSTLYLVTWYQ